MRVARRTARRTRSIQWRPQSNGWRDIARTEAEKGETGSRIEENCNVFVTDRGVVATKGALVVKAIRGLDEATIAADVHEGSGNTHPVMIINVPKTRGAHSGIDGALYVRRRRATRRRSQRRRGE